MDKRIVSIDAVIDRIKMNGWIDCSENLGFTDGYEYDNILYHLEKSKDLQQRIDKAIEILEKRKHVEKLMGGVEKSNTDKIIDILKGDIDG